MTGKLITVAVAVLLIIGAYVYGRMATTEGIDAIVDRHEEVLADTLAVLNAVRDSLHDANRVIAAKVDTLTLVRTRLVSDADMWEAEAATTASQVVGQLQTLSEHLAERGDSVGMQQVVQIGSAFGNLIGQHNAERTSLREALAVGDSIQAFQLAVIGNLRIELNLADERFAASERARLDIVEDLKKRDRHKTLKNVVKVGGTALAVLTGCRLAPESVC